MSQTKPQILQLVSHAPARAMEKQKPYNPKEKEEIEVPDNPIFLKIQQTLQKTDPEKWRRAGEDLSAAQKYPKAIDSWDQAFILDIKDGVLVLRSCQPVKSDYFGGGFTLTPTAAENCFVEIRGKGWNLRELVDPYYRTTVKKDNKLQTLVEGPMAFLLFREVKKIVESYSTDCRREFERDCFSLMQDLPELIKASSYESWQKIDMQHQNDVVRYLSTFRGMSVEIIRVIHDDKQAFHLKMGKSEMYKTMTSSQTEELFETIENLGRDARLMTLSNMLEGIDL